MKRTGCIYIASLILCVMSVLFDTLSFVHYTRIRSAYEHVSQQLSQSYFDLDVCQQMEHWFSSQVGKMRTDVRKLESEKGGHLKEVEELNKVCVFVFVFVLFCVCFCFYFCFSFLFLFLFLFLFTLR